MAARSKVRVCGRSLAGIAGSNPAGSIDVCQLSMFRVLSRRSLQRANPSSRKVLPNVMCHCVWRRKHKNEAVLVRFGLRPYNLYDTEVVQLDGVRWPTPHPWKNSLLLASETGSGLGVDLKSLACTGFRISDHSARRESLYRLRYPGRQSAESTASQKWRLSVCTLLLFFPVSRVVSVAAFSRYDASDLSPQLRFLQ